MMSGGGMLGGGEKVSLLLRVEDALGEGRQQKPFPRRRYSSGLRSKQYPHHSCRNKPRMHEEGRGWAHMLPSSVL